MHTIVQPFYRSDTEKYQDTCPSLRKLRIAAKCRPSRSMKTEPSAAVTRLCRPLNIALKRDGEGALRSVVTVVMKRWPPTFKFTCGFISNEWLRLYLNGYQYGLTVTICIPKGHTGK